ncbi:hypothetical protein VNO77_44623 [Canavalia gladiata]|uniref:Uncharacterized protein n=1 Tax=Canavalia gladiata TaxID=3824 RepID=A0AAN9JYF1_CANGL
MKCNALDHYGHTLARPSKTMSYIPIGFYTFTLRKLPPDSGILSQILLEILDYSEGRFRRVALGFQIFSTTDSVLPRFPSLSCLACEVLTELI